MMYSPTLAELPPPPSGKTGWPWTVTSPMSHGLDLDSALALKVSIITPSYNQGLFIEETIRSVLLQGYPNLEYVIIDGGSTDSTVEILQKYDRWLTAWVSEPDRGQGNAINKGLEIASGDILNFINSDDIFLPGAIWSAIAGFLSHRHSPSDPLPDRLVAVYGNRTRIDTHSNTFDFDLPPQIISSAILRCGAWIPSETFFFTRAIYRKIGGFSEDLRFAIDYDYYLRCYRASVKFQFVDRFLGAMRFHESSKTVSTGMLASTEFKALRSKYLGRGNLAKIGNWTADKIFSRLFYRLNQLRKMVLRKPII